MTSYPYWTIWRTHGHLFAASYGSILELAEWFEHNPDVRQYWMNVGGGANLRHIVALAVDRELYRRNHIHETG